MAERHLPAVVLLVALLGGCGGQDGPAPASPPAPTASPPSEGPTTPPGGSPSPAAAAPSSVRIPSLDLDERLVGLGIAGSGELEVPEDPARVGWFTGGGRPGGRGPTVLVGHLDSRTGPAVFARLPELGRGDAVSVTTEDGTTVDYVVTRTEDFSQGQDAFPTEDVFGATGGDALRLITCTGPYDQQAGRYTENRVVFAEPA